MLNEEEIRSLIVLILTDANNEAGCERLLILESQIDILLFVLTEQKPPLHNGSVPVVCEAAGIPIEWNDDGTIGFPSEWLADHGFEVQGDEIRHPRFCR